jgi:Short C-terminal domain
VPVTSRRRRILVLALVVAGSLIGFGAILTTWVNRQVLDNHSWRNTSAQLIRNQRVQTTLSGYVVNQLYGNVNIAGTIEQRLPKQLKPLADPIAAAVRAPAAQAVTYLLAQPRVQQRFVNASGIAHKKLVDVLENKTGYGIRSGNGVVTVDLHALIRQIGSDVGIPASALDRLPARIGVVTVMRSSQLSLAEDGVRAVRLLSVWLVVLVFGLFALAVYFARGARRKTIRTIGWAFVLTGLAGLALRQLTERYVVDGVVPAFYRAAGDRVWLISSSTLSDISWSIILYGAIIVLAAALTGTTRAAIAVRRWIAPALNHAGIAWSLAAATYLLALLWGGTHELRTTIGALLTAALLAAGVVVLRRQTLREFPDARLSDMADRTRASCDRAMQFARSSRATRVSPQPASSGSPADEIVRLNELRDSGLLTDEEFERGKTLVLFGG